MAAPVDFVTDSRSTVSTVAFDIAGAAIFDCPVVKVTADADSAVCFTAANTLASADRQVAAATQLRVVEGQDKELDAVTMCAWEGPSPNTRGQDGQETSYLVPACSN